jgi:hypothetical protein
MAQEVFGPEAPRLVDGRTVQWLEVDHIGMDLKWAEHFMLVVLN